MKNNGVMMLLVVALLALAVLTVIGVQGSSTGAVQGIGGGSPIGVGGSYYPPVREESQVYQIHSGVASQSTETQMMVEDLLHVYLAQNCLGASLPEVVRICNKYDVSTV